jgi:formylglycine-generating enzyme required for sulfatase activity
MTCACVIDTNQYSWIDGVRPSWASAWGHDELGVYAEFTLGKVVQRLRWIPPGRFLMGSPEDEAGRFANEGPRHEVTLAAGFWMMDTPVRQNLWRAVTGGNPSQFGGPEWPVENVDLADITEFLSRLKQRVPGLDLALPSEAQWEYACRAGGDAAIYADDLDGIAWFNGDETYPVAQKLPNAFGLFDMLGNVWEWCADHWRDAYSGAPADDSPWRERDNSAANHVVRGGAWGELPRSVRAARRTANDPSCRANDLGFRCVQTKTSGAAAMNPAPKTAAIKAISSSAELAPTSCPAWATRFGEDPHGLFAEFTIDATVQRLRWIPPGRFRMGSPDGEEGRFDDEGPRHAVTLASGFWMMDTPVRQSLWQGMMGDNPSRFRSPERPVETVDCEMIARFLSRLSQRIPGLDLALPSEAQWEYACRAGSETATYAGDLEILGEHNAPVLDGIAWYRGNSGDAFERESGYPASGPATHPVGRKLANAFGLHDMLGNVWEWCLDHWHDDYEDFHDENEDEYTCAPTDGSAWIMDGNARAPRVLRGGSWLHPARFVRAASRIGLRQAHRSADVGFRCVSVLNEAK